MLAIWKIDLFSKMLPLGCVDYDYLKGLKKLVPRAFFSYIGTWEFFLEDSRSARSTWLQDVLL